jgi:hypothetical protein
MKPIIKEKELGCEKENVYEGKVKREIVVIPRLDTEAV